MNHASLAGRYRIIGLIGRGGMGEVYHADDLKLGQPVALKFLPKALADDSIRRERLFAEVRIARQVSHPNICRVYDIAELEGRHFLTMEYIDGEDLASLLKRIGNLHGAKALDVARQLCAGLAAAHDKGVLHRDLKPANVMIDGHGRVRITDFGLAVAEEDETAEGDVSGTPPYMAPEQFACKGASVRSDIYALDLIFYEVFTGRRAFDEKTLADLRQKKETSSPTAPSEIARDIEPFVRRRWPGLLTGWSRLLSGAYRDSLIGRDLLFGCGAGVVWAVALHFRYPLSQWFGIPGIRPFTDGLSFMPGGQAFIAGTAEYILQGIILSLLVGFIFFLVRVLFRSTWAALAAIALFTVILGTGGTGGSFSVATIPPLLAVGVGVFLFFRLGFLAMATELIVCYMLLYPPISSQISAWYSWMGLTVLALLLALALYAFHTSLGGQPMFGRASLED